MFDQIKVEMVARARELLALLTDEQVLELVCNGSLTSIAMPRTQLAPKMPVTPRAGGDRDEAVLNVIAAGVSAMGEIASAAGLPVSQAQRVVHRLMQQGRITSTGARKWCRYGVRRDTDAGAMPEVLDGEPVNIDEGQH